MRHPAVIARLWPLAAVAALVLACSSEPSVTTSPNPTTPGSTTGRTASGSPGRPTTSAPSTAPTVSTPTPAGIGSTLTLVGNTPGQKLDVTVVKVVDPAGAENQYSTPEAGTRYVAVQFRLHNTGTVVYQDSPTNGARLIDQQGQQFRPSPYDSAAGPGFGGSVTVIPGDTALGYITFQVPTASTPAKVQFTLDSGFGPSTGQWTVS